MIISLPKNESITEAEGSGGKGSQPVGRLDGREMK